MLNAFRNRYITAQYVKSVKTNYLQTDYMLIQMDGHAKISAFACKYIFLNIIPVKLETSF